MHISSFLLFVVTAAVAAGNIHDKIKQLKPAKIPKRPLPLESRGGSDYSNSIFMNRNSRGFLVDGKSLPNINFDIGESYAGLLSVSSNYSDPSQLFFWFFPSSNEAAKNEIMIWLNGGPGCSSLNGLFQENGPFTWKPGTYGPQINQYSWVNLTNVVWIDQPCGTGFSQGTPNFWDETQVTEQFMGFWKNFVNTFGMENYDIYITGESFAGQYIPYFANGMLDQKDKIYYNVKGIQIIDPSINTDPVLQQVPVVPFLHQYNNILNLNDSYLQYLTTRADECGYTEFYNKHTVFPPSGPMPPPPNPDNMTGCYVFDEAYLALLYVNPCFNIYHITDFCPYLWDELGFTGLGDGPSDYFNRSDVQKALHVPPTNFMECGEHDIFPNGDHSPPSGLGPLSSIIERTNNVLISHGLLDMLLMANGTLMTIQNMTWNGKQGFQQAPASSKNFYVPYNELAELLFANPSKPFTQDAGAGLQGTWHTERGLTYCTIDLAGHEMPKYTPGAAYRQLEFLLGRIKDLSQQGDYTTMTGNFTGTIPPF